MGLRGRPTLVAVVLAVSLAATTSLATPAAAVHDSSGDGAADGTGGGGSDPTTDRNETASATTDRPARETTNATPRLNRTGESTVTVRVGEDDARMRIVVDFSLFSNMPAPGRLEFSTAGMLAGERVVAVEMGLSFLGVGDPLTFLGNPFSRFAVDAHSELSLPFLAESPDGEVRAT